MRYNILKTHIKKYPLLIGGDIHGAAAHTLVHFLYTGTYETMASPLERNVSFKEREFHRSIYVYQVSRSCKIPDLTKLAIKHIEEYSKGVPFPDILRWTAQIFPKLPKDEVWLQNFVGTILRRAAKIGDLRSGVDDPSRILAMNQPFREALYDYLFRNSNFTKDVLRMICSDGGWEPAKNLDSNSQQQSIASKKRPAPE